MIKTVADKFGRAPTALFNFLYLHGSYLLTVGAAGNHDEFLAQCDLESASEKMAQEVMDVWRRGS